MPWWSWIVVGAVLLGAELIGVDAAFYLLFIGIAAILTGLLQLAGLGMPDWLQWLVFAALAISSMVLFRKRLYNKLRGDIPDYEVGPSGETIRLESNLNPGDKARQSLRGTTWTIFNGGNTAIGQGDDARIIEVRGTTLVVANNDTE